MTFFVIALGLGIKLIPKLLERIHGLDISEGPFITALALGFGLAVLAHFLGQSSAIGAFIMGMIIASSKYSESIVKKVLPLRDFFGVIFFVSIGMLVNITVIPEVVLISIPIIILAVVGKFVGGFFGASVGGNSLTSSSTIGAVMVPRGEFSFIMAKQAVDSGAVREMLYPVTMLVTLATMFCMPLLLKILPTRADKQSFIPIKFLNLIFTLGRFFNKLMKKSEDDTQYNILLKTHGPKFFVNLMIVIAILAIMDYFSADIINLITDLGIPLLIDPEILLTIISILLIIYPIIAMLGKIEKFVGSISDILSTKLIPADTMQLERKPLHRFLRNIFFVGFILVIIAIIEPYIADIEFLPYLSFIISGIGLAVALILITDSILIFQKISHSHIMESLMKEDESSDPE